MHITLRRAVACVLAVLLGLCSMAHADPAQDQAALTKASHAWLAAFNAHDIDGLLALMTADAVLLDPAVPPASGREAVRRALQQALAGSRGKATLATKELVIAGDVAWRIGTLTHGLDGETLGRSQLLEIWKRSAGAWKLHRQMSSNVLTQPHLVPGPRPADPALDQPAH